MNKVQIIELIIGTIGIIWSLIKKIINNETTTDTTSNNPDNINSHSVKRMRDYRKGTMRKSKDDTTDSKT